MTVDLYGAESKKLPEGQRLFEAGDAHSNRFYVLRRGTVNIIRDSEILNSVSTQNYPIGSIGIILDLPRSATVVADENVVYLEEQASPQEVYEWLINSPEHLLSEIKNLCAMVDHLNQQNKKEFERFREVRDLFEPFLQPLQKLTPIIDQKQMYKPLRLLISAQKKIVRDTGESEQRTLDIDISDDVISTVERGDVLCEEGTDGNAVYILIEGSLAVLKASQLVARIDEPGILFGEMATLTDGVRKATVRAEMASRVAKIPPDLLIEYFDDSPAIARKITDMMLERYRGAVELNDNLTFFRETVIKIYNSDTHLKRSEDAIREALNKLSSSERQEYEDAVSALESWLKNKPEIPDELKFTESADPDDKSFTKEI